jgi:hypothetical protein
MYKLGKLPRTFNPKITHMSSLLCYKNLPAPPSSVDWSCKITDFGMMLNDQLGDCSCAAIYHARQIWTANASMEKTEIDENVLSLYEGSCGYNPDDASSDQGGILQNVLLYCTINGFQIGDKSKEKFMGFIEVDTGDVKDIKIAINDFGLVYIGFSLPDSIYDSSGNPLSTAWDVVDKSNILGGHCVIIVGYDETGLTIVSWGSIFKITWKFFSMYVDEAYAILSQDWLDNSKKTPLGLTIEELTDLMIAIKE